MLNNFFYSHSVWVVAILVCGVLTGLPLIGLAILNRISPSHKREEDTSMVGLSYALVGGIYAVVLAFVAVGVYEALERSTNIASAEADSLGSLTYDSAGLPKELGELIRVDVYKYIDIVHEKEWPAQQAYHMEESNYAEGWTQMRKISRDISAYEPATPGQATVKATMVHLTNDLLIARNSRLLAANEHLPDAVWEMLIFGLLLVVVYIYLFGPHSFRMHLAVTALTMVSISLIFTLVIALDYPFRGELSVSDESLLSVKEVSHLTFASHEATTANYEHEK
jgi:hypothetical protein